MQIFGKQYQDLLLELLRIPTVSPFAMEVWDPDLAKHRNALDAIVEFTKDSELQPEYYEVPPESYYQEIEFRGRKIRTPLMVAEMYKEHPKILDAQPNLVLRAGKERDAKYTICFNCHIDTVRPFLESGFEDGVFYGRGAVDMKGPLTSTLAGILHAIEQYPSLLNDISIRLQVVSGEEAGPMGIIGTAVVVKEGLTGAPNVVSEASRNSYFDSAAAAMTPMIVTRRPDAYSRDSIDATLNPVIKTNGPNAHDGSPHEGFAGMHILGYINKYLDENFLGFVKENEGTYHPISMQTDEPNHNRVYGKASVQYGISCQTGDIQTFKTKFDTMVESAVAAYKEEYASHPLYGKTAELANQVIEITWPESEVQKSDFIDMHLLWYINTYMEKEYIPFILENGGTYCPAGMQTNGSSQGQSETGFVKYNILCPEDELVEPFKNMFESEVKCAIEAYKKEFADHPLYGETAKNLDQAGDLPVTETIWLKSGFPVHTSTHSTVEQAVLEGVDPASKKGVDPYCCDLIWFDGPSVVLGPGDLSDNDAHGPTEHMHITDLEKHAQLISDMIYRFRNYVVSRN